MKTRLIEVPLVSNQAPQLVVPLKPGQVWYTPAQPITATNGPVQWTHTLRGDGVQIRLMKVMGATNISLIATVASLVAKIIKERPEARELLVAVGSPFTPPDLFIGFGVECGNGDWRD